MAANRRSARSLTPPRAPRLRVVLWASFAALGLGLAAYLVSLLLRPGDPYWTWLDGWGICAVELWGSALCIARGIAGRPIRTAPLALGIGLLAWAVGQTLMTAQSVGGATPPGSSLADVFSLIFYPLAYVAAVIFMRGDVRGSPAPNGWTAASPGWVRRPCAAPSSTTG